MMYPTSIAGARAQRFEVLGDLALAGRVGGDDLSVEHMLSLVVDAQDIQNIQKQNITKLYHTVSPFFLYPCFCTFCVFF